MKLKNMTAIEKSKRISLLKRVVLIWLFLGSLMLSTALVTVKYAGIYTITYQPDQLRILYSFIIAAFLAMALPARVNRIDRLIVWLLVLMSAIPLLIPYALGQGSAYLLSVSMLFWVMLAMQSRVSIRIPFSMPAISGSWWVMSIFFGLLTFYSILTAFIVAGLTLSLDFSMVYEIRNHFKSTDIPLANYTYKWTAFIVVPLLFFGGIYWRKRILSAVAIIIMFILYFATGHKTFLFIIPFTCLIYWVWTKPRPGAWLVISLSALIFSGMVTYYALGETRLNASFSNRLFVLPAQITYDYHDYFSENPKVKLSHSIFSGMFEYPYSQMPSKIVSTVYYNNPGGYANTGTVGDAFMNFGYPAIIVLFVLVSVTLHLIAKMPRDKNPLLVLALVLMPLFTWVNSGFLTSILISGLAWSVMGLWILPYQKEYIVYRDV